MQICSACSLESIIFTDFYIQIHLTWQKTCKLNLISFSHLTLFLFLGLGKMPETEKYCAWFWNISPLDWKQFNVETKAKQCLEKKNSKNYLIIFFGGGMFGPHLKVLWVYSRNFIQMSFHLGSGGSCVMLGI